MSRHLIILVMFSMAACSSRPSEPVMVADQVAACAPGRPYDKCIRALETARARGGVFPAGALNGLELLLVHVAEGGVPLAASTQISFRHLMYFRGETVRPRVMSLLQAELGPPTNKGVPPIGDPGVFVGDFWIVGDGIWICSEKSVLWYSKSFHDDGTWVTRTEAAPTSGPLWNKVGQLLATI